VSPQTASGRRLETYLDTAGRLSRDTSFPFADEHITAIEREAQALVLDALEAALEREPSLDEVREYGLDQPDDARAVSFNTLQWRLDLIREAIQQQRSKP
jgi:hypothetical protein